jgi:hypothetical protein
MTQSKTSVNYKDFTVQDTQADIQNEASSFTLKPIPSRDAFQIIEKLTNRFNPEHNINEKFIQQLQTRLDADKIIYEGSINAPDNVDMCNNICGTGNCQLYQTIIQQNIAMIWHDKCCETPSFRFWGDKMNVITAMNVIKYRISIME